ncbi:MAG: YcxB family protein, partial [bacterium]
FQNDKILGKEGNSESLISYKDFNEIIEIEKYIFVKIFSTETLILPKSINNFDKINQEIEKNLLKRSKEFTLKNTFEADSNSFF